MGPKGDHIGSMPDMTGSGASTVYYALGAFCRRCTGQGTGPDHHQHFTKYMDLTAAGGARRLDWIGLVRLSCSSLVTLVSVPTGIGQSEPNLRNFSFHGCFLNSHWRGWRVGRRTGGLKREGDGFVFVTKNKQ